MTIDFLLHKSFYTRGCSSGAPARLGRLRVSMSRLAVRFVCRFPIGFSSLSPKPHVHVTTWCTAVTLRKQCPRTKSLAWAIGASTTQGTRLKALRASQALSTSREGSGYICRAVCVVTLRKATREANPRNSRLYAGSTLLGRRGKACKA